MATAGSNKSKNPVRPAGQRCYAVSMRLIVAALAEELHLALSLCSTPEKVKLAGATAWRAVAGGENLHLYKTGAGPQRSARRLVRILAGLNPSYILVIGYAGALHPELSLGDLVIGKRVSAIAEDRAPLEEIQLAGSWELTGSAEMLQLAKGAELPAQVAEILTTPCIIGAPNQKILLQRRFQATTVDMETASLARVAEARGIPIGCVRAVSDRAADTFLAPFTYDPDSTPAGSAIKIAAAGHWIARHKVWRQQAALARRSLGRFLACYLQNPPTFD